jgi:hypothetical protein
VSRPRLGDRTYKVHLDGYNQMTRSRADSRRGLSLADTMKRLAMLTQLVLVSVIGVIGPPALAQGLVASQDETRGVTLAQATPEIAKLIGRWVRPDGGYAIVIKSVDPSGKLDATYFNPNPINVSKAEVSVAGGSVRIFIELRGVGYPGSTYTLTYLPAGDRLTGVYYQAAIQQKFDVIFQRAR